MASIIAIVKQIMALGDLIKILIRAVESFKVWRAEKAVKKVEKEIKKVDEAKKILRKKIEEESSKEAPDDEAIKDMHRRITRISLKL